MERLRKKLARANRLVVVLPPVKLKWLNSSSTSQPDESVGQQLLANGNQLDTLRAGQSLAWECAASSQPRPRIRWFKLTLAASSGAPLQQQQQQQATRLVLLRNNFNNNNARQLDEAQLKAALTQSERPPVAYQRIELPLGAKGLYPSA